MRRRIALATGVLLVEAAILAAPPLTTATAGASDTTFVAVNSGGISLYSSATGRRIRSLATFSHSDWTNNGLAYSSDDRAVYYTLIPRRHTRAFSLHLMRLDVVTGRQTFVADGSQPALSQNDRQLAYAAAPRGLAVRDLATGSTRTVALKQLGKAADMINASIHWLADGSDVAIVPSPTAWDLMGKPPKLSWCGTSQRHPVVVFVHVPPSPGQLTATCVRLSGPKVDGAITLGSSGAAPRTLLLAGSTGAMTDVEKVAETGAATPILAIPDSLPQSFDPSGTHLLYIAGHKPPRLTEASIANGRLTPGPWQTRKYLGAVAW